MSALDLTKIASLIRAINKKAGHCTYLHLFDMDAFTCIEGALAYKLVRTLVQVIYKKRKKC